MKQYIVYDGDGKNEFDTLREAERHVESWLGFIYPGPGVIQINEKYFYSGDDFILISEVENNPQKRKLI
jgi:hypothetical protein